MDTPGAISADELAGRVRLAQAAFEQHRALCFWSWPINTRVTPELLPNVAHALRTYGGRAEFILSERICPSTIYRAKYLPRYAPTETPTAT